MPFAWRSISVVALVAVLGLLRFCNLRMERCKKSLVPTEKGLALNSVVKTMRINEQLMIQFNRIINENISNVNMDVNFIAQQMGMSRAFFIHVRFILFSFVGICGTSYPVLIE